METPESKPRLRPRISLLSLLLITALAATSLSSYLLWSEVGPLRAEVRRLRDEVGELNITDPTKLHAIRVDTDNELVWKWRLWMPKGASYLLRSSGDGDPGLEGYPSDGGTIQLNDFQNGGEEIVVTYQVRRDPRDDKWYGGLSCQGSGVGRDLQSWVEWSSRSTRTSGVGRTTKIIEPAKPIELIRHRVSPQVSAPPVEGETTPADPSGFVIWLEQNTNQR